MKNVKLSIKKEKSSNGTKFVSIVDQDGVVCGIYNNEKQAEKVLNVIEQNINRGSLHEVCVKNIS